jgi:cytochrome c oxidase cbb3-type subunit 3
MNTLNQNKKRISLAVIGVMAMPFVSAAQETSAATNTYFSNALFNTLLSIIILLAIIVVALSGVLKNISNSDLLIRLMKKNDTKSNSGSASAIALFFLLFSNLSTFAQGRDLPKGDDKIGGLDQFTFYFMSTVIGIELIVIGVLIYTLRYLLKSDEVASATVAGSPAKPKEKTIIDLLSDAVDIENEESILLDHDYDGIKELDNNLPPWWKYGFYLTILVGVVYLINYHVIKSSPLQAEEYTIAMKKAEAEVAEFMKTSANNVDENTVKLLTDASDLAAGKDIFMTTCSACHGKLGEGSVGPNLTDDYWIHPGSVKEIFKTIKYGYPDKGMKSWKDDYSPIQIAQVTSYIKTLRGTNPPKPKDKQGDLYLEEGTTPQSDSTAVIADSLKVVALADTLKK